MRIINTPAGVFGESRDGMWYELVSPEPQTWVAGTFDEAVGKGYEPQKCPVLTAPGMVNYGCELCVSEDDHFVVGGAVQDGIKPEPFIADEATLLASFKPPIFFTGWQIVQRKGYIYPTRINISEVD